MKVFCRMASSEDALKIALDVLTALTLVDGEYANFVAEFCDLWLVERWRGVYGGIVTAAALVPRRGEDHAATILDFYWHDVVQKILPYRVSLNRQTHYLDMVLAANRDQQEYSIISNYIRTLHDDAACVAGLSHAKYPTFDLIASERLDALVRRNPFVKCFALAPGPDGNPAATRVSPTATSSELPLRVNPTIGLLEYQLKHRIPTGELPPVIQLQEESQRC